MKKTLRERMEATVSNMATMRQFARCFSRELPLLFAKTSARGSALSSATMSPSQLVSKAMGSVVKASEVRWQAEPMTNLQRSIFGAAGAGTRGAASIPGPQLPVMFDTTHLEKGLSAASGAGSMVEGGSPAGVPVPGADEDDEEGVLPYRRDDMHKLSRFKDDHQREPGGNRDSMEQQPQPRSRKPLSPAEVRFLWARAQQMATDRSLTRIKIGKQGITAELLAELQSQLRVKELIRVDILPGSGLDVRMVKALLPELLDCVALRVQGFTLTLFRDGSSASPVRSLHMPRNIANRSR